MPRLKASLLAVHMCGVGCHAEGRNKSPAEIDGNPKTLLFCVFKQAPKALCSLNHMFV